MKLGHIELFVRDVAAACEFFRDVLGCRVLEPGEDRYLWVRLGGQEILLRPDRRSGPPPPAHASGIALVLYVDDLDAAAAELRGKGVVLKDVEDTERRLTFTDPDGHWFHLVQAGE